MLAGDVEESPQQSLALEASHAVRLPSILRFLARRAPQADRCSGYNQRHPWARSQHGPPL